MFSSTRSIQHSENKHVLKFSVRAVSEEHKLLGMVWYRSVYSSNWKASFPFFTRSADLSCPGLWRRCAGQRGLRAAARTQLTVAKAAGLKEFPGLCWLFCLFDLRMPPMMPSELCQGQLLCSSRQPFFGRESRPVWQRGRGAWFSSVVAYLQALGFGVQAPRSIQPIGGAVFVDNQRQFLSILSTLRARLSIHRAASSVQDVRDGRASPVSAAGVC